MRKLTFGSGYCPSTEYTVCLKSEVESAEKVSNSSYDENSTEDVGKIKVEIDPLANMIDDAKKTVRMLQTDEKIPDFYVDDLRWMTALKEDSIHKKIMEMSEMNEDFFYPDEVLPAAVDNECHLILV